MQLKKLVWHIFPANLIITIGSLLAILWYSSVALDTFYTNWLAIDLRDRAYFIEDQVAKLLVLDEMQELNVLCRQIGRKAATRITVIAPSGQVVADSAENPAIMSNHSNRPEVKSAMAGQIGRGLRFSSTLGLKMLYVAIPLSQNHQAGQQSKFHVLRLAKPAAAIGHTLENIRLQVAFSACIVAILAMLAAIIVSRRISKPLEKMTEGAEQFAHENFNTYLDIPSNCSLEIGRLAAAMNSMAKKLQERFGTIVQQNNELQTILASMADAVIVIDQRKQIIKMNSAASLLFGVAEKKAVGKSTEEILKEIQIERLIDMTLVGKATVTEEISLKKGGEKRFLQYSGVRLYDDNGASLGAVMALSDVTKIRRLENVRQEFVANVSHELMTPLTSIKGYTETIIDNTEGDPEQTEKFLQIILRQSNRLQSIVNDLLKLSRIEQDIEDNEIHLVPTKVKDVLHEAIQVCVHMAEEKNIVIKLHCPVNFMVPMDAPLIEQAIVNLLVNAIKYSDPASEVVIRAELQVGKDGQEMAIITVKDYGVGVAKEHLSRLFERFYRSDKARSRKLGGTGLGLAIVKHIVQAHEGSVDVSSEAGKGSVFTIVLPA